MAEREIELRREHDRLGTGPGAAERQMPGLDSAATAAAVCRRRRTRRHGPRRRSSGTPVERSRVHGVVPVAVDPVVDFICFIEVVDEDDPYPSGPDQVWGSERCLHPGRFRPTSGPRIVDPGLLSGMSWGG